MRTLRQQIDANKRWSIFLGFLLVVLLSLLGGVFAEVYSPGSLALGAAGAAVLGVVAAIVAHYAGGSIVLQVSAAREATHDEDRRLRNVAEEMAIAAGIPMPKVYIIDDPSPNAFATGKDPRSGVVVFTTGLIEKLDRDELQGVMAHEIAHIRNYDIRFMTTIGLVAGLIPLISDLFLRSLWYGGGRRRKSEGQGQGQLVMLAIGIALAILAPLFAKLLELAVSRQREYMADATAAELTRYPDGLARALQKIASDPAQLGVRNRATEHMYIVNPFRPMQIADTLFSTHPPIERRIAALRGLMGRYRGPLTAEERRQLNNEEFQDLVEES